MSFSKNKTHIALTLIFILALAVRLTFFATFKDVNILSGITQTQGEIGHNISSHSRYFVVDLDRIKQLSTAQSKQNRLINPSEYPPNPNPNFSAPVATDTPFYGLLLGKIWQITGDENFRYIQYLQILLDSCLIFFIFGIGRRLFNKNIGLLTATFFALYAPEAIFSIVPLRDVWGSFASISLLYGLTIAYKSQSLKPSPTLIITSAIFALFCLIRANFALLPFFFVPFILLIWKNKKSALTTSATIILTSLIFFWTPLIIYNQHTYDRAFTSPVGIGLWEGFGTFDNPFGAVNNDESTIEAVRRAGFDYPYGSPQFNDKIKELAIAAIKQEPGLFIKNLIRRIPIYLTLELDVQDFYGECRASSSVITCFAQHPFNFFITRWNKLFGIMPLIGLISFLLALYFFPKYRREILVLTPIALYTFFFTWHGGWEPRYLVISNHVFLFLKALIIAFLLAKLAKKCKITAV